MTADADPWSLPTVDERIALAKSILGHTKPTDARTKTAIDRAVLALSGATIDEIQEVTG